MVLTSKDGVKILLDSTNDLMIVEAVQLIASIAVVGFMLFFIVVVVLLILWSKGMKKRNKEIVL